MEKKLKSIVKSVPAFSGNARIRADKFTNGVFYIVPGSFSHGARIIQELRSAGFYAAFVDSRENTIKAATNANIIY